MQPNIEIESEIEMRFGSRRGEHSLNQNFKDGAKYKNTGKAGIFAGSLELVKEGNLTIKQENLFDEIYIKEIK